ncbi:unnamed protein product [Schistosoma curassoni]|nr:unnamed protein product [Schistosoma curassoni]
MSLSKFSNLFLDDLPIHRFSTSDLNVYLQDIINQLLHIKESEDPTFPVETMNILVDLPNKYVDSIEFLNFTRGLYKESTLL